MEPRVVDYARPRDDESPRPPVGGTIARIIVGIIAFVVGTVAGFYLLVFLWIQFNTSNRDEMSQGIAGSMFALFVALPLGICAGVGAATIAVSLMRHRMQRSSAPPPSEG
jgi:hypothetical protein